MPKGKGNLINFELAGWDSFASRIRGPAAPQSCEMRKWPFDERRTEIIIDPHGGVEEAIEGIIEQSRRRAARRGSMEQ